MVPPVAMKLLWMDKILHLNNPSGATVCWCLRGNQILPRFLNGGAKWTSCIHRIRLGSPNLHSVAYSQQPSPNCLESRNASRIRILQTFPSSFGNHLIAKLHFLCGCSWPATWPGEPHAPGRPSPLDPPRLKQSPGVDSLLSPFELGNVRKPARNVWKPFANCERSRLGSLQANDGQTRHKPNDPNKRGLAAGNIKKKKTANASEAKFSSFLASKPKRHAHRSPLRHRHSWHSPLRATWTATGPDASAT